jgi:NADH:ubiquinone oxidoreductase subunit
MHKLPEPKFLVGKTYQEARNRKREERSRTEQLYNNGAEADLSNPM